MNFAFVVLVSGSRRWNDHLSVKRCFDRHDIVAEGKHSPTVIHGDQDGLDKMAGRIARARRWNVIAVPARPPRTTTGSFQLVAADFHARNDRLVAFLELFRESGYATHVACFPLEDSRGTWDLHRRAKRAKFKPEVIRG